MKEIKEQELKLRYLDDEILSKKSQEIDIIDESVKNLALSMLSKLEDFHGVGLSAVQVGYLLRIFVVDTRIEGERAVFINPTILSTSQDNVSYEEGCLSIPLVYREVKRPSSVTIQAKDENGKVFTLTAEGLFARAIQHEYDHLDGKLFIDHLDEIEKESAVKEFKKNIKKLKKNKII